MDAVKLFRTSPFHDWLGCQVERMDKEEVVLLLPFRKEFVGDPENPAYHGGVLAALVDTAGTFALIATTGHDWITVDMRIDYQRVARPGPILARAVTVRAGRRFGLADVTIADANERTIAAGRLTLAAAPGRSSGGEEAESS